MQISNNSRWVVLEPLETLLTGQITRAARKAGPSPVKTSSSAGNDQLEPQMDSGSSHPNT
jgi:hypothetical protein